MGQIHHQHNNKSNQALGYLRLNVGIQDQHLKRLVYQTLVQPKLVYSALILDPHEKKKKKQLDMVTDKSGSVYNIKILR